MNTNVLLAALFGVCALGGAVATCSTGARAHDWYTGKTTKTGFPCCNEQDCLRLDRAWTDDAGVWRFVYPPDGRVYVVPEEAIHPDEENPEPFQASGCVYHGRVICFWRKRAGG